jgi:biopolymer transport protein ExbD
MSGSMAASSTGGNSRGRRTFLTAAAESQELDMTPMMNILIILISFLVTMVVFTHLAVVKFNLPPGQSAQEPSNGQETGAETSSQKDLTVILSESGYQVLAEGKQYDPLPKGKQGYDTVGLAKELQDVKSVMPFNENVVLLIDSAVLYQDIISTMDVCRENKFPKVLLSGGLVE